MSFCEVMQLVTAIWQMDGGILGILPYPNLMMFLNRHKHHP
jgi:hypothetical protein